MVIAFQQSHRGNGPDRYRRTNEQAATVSGEATADTGLASGAVPEPIQRTRSLPFSLVLLLPVPERAIELIVMDRSMLPDWWTRGVQQLAVQMDRISKDRDVVTEGTEWPIFLYDPSFADFLPELGDFDRGNAPPEWETNRPYSTSGDVERMADSIVRYFSVLERLDKKYGTPSNRG